MPLDPQRVQSLFLAAVKARTPTARAVLLDDECGADAELRQRVEALLRAHDASDSFPEGSPLALVGTVDDPISERPGSVIGSYKLMEQIGEGGMGLVFVAEQQQPVRRKVALKVIKPGMDTRQVVARFEAERQALALMDHPSIAKVLDGGTTESGRPYFVMELVKGVPVSDYCDHHQLPIRQRLEVFVSVCQAVQHAHQKGIIHRDIKPSNVLVMSHDDTPVVKVIDFGVAKAIGQPLTDKTIYTQFSQMVGTPLYMSPEQAGQSGLDVDTRSDIYSLGVLLYELLTGTTPFERERLRSADYEEIRRIIREEEAPRPSTRISTLGQAATTISTQRQSEPKQLSRQIRGELDWIVMKALEKDRNRRYETANGLAMDVQRYLTGEPVLAVPASRWYRLRKVMRRHRGPVWAAGGVFGTLLIGIAGTTWGLARAVGERDAKDVALKAEQQARADETKARQQAFAALRSMTADVVERKFTQAMLTEDDRAFLRGVIAQYDAFAAIKGDDADSRAVRAEGRLRVGTMRLTLGEHKEAEQDFNQAVSIRKQLAADFPDRPEFRADLVPSYLNRCILLGQTGRLKEAEKDYDQALSIQKQLMADFPNRPEYRPELARIYYNRGKLLSETGRLTEAEQDHDQAQIIYKQLAAEFPTRSEFREKLALSHDSRGNLLEATGRFKEAEQDHDQALSIRKRLAADFPSQPRFREGTAASHLNRGRLLKNMGRPKEAEQDYEQALSIQKQLAADFPSQPRFRQALATGHNNRGNLLKDTGRPQEAEQDYDQAVSIQKQLVADFPTHLEFRKDLARSHSNRGNLLKNTGRVNEAEQEYGQALSIYRQLAADFPSLPEARQVLADSHCNRGNLLHAAGRPKEAEKDFDQAVRIYQQLAADFPTRPEFRQLLAGSHGNRGILLGIMGRLTEAEREYEQTLSIQRQLAADFPNQPDLRNNLAGCCVNLATLHRRQENWAAAKRLLLEGRPHHLAALKANPRHPRYRQFYRNHLTVLTEIHAGLLEQEDAIRTAEICRNLGWNAPVDAYDAARFLSRCVPIVAKHDKLDDKQRKEAAQFYSDQAMKLLRAAVSKGYKDVARMKKYADLAPLSTREDFRKLVAELEAYRPPSGKK